MVFWPWRKLVVLLSFYWIIFFIYIDLINIDNSVSTVVVLKKIVNTKLNNEFHLWNRSIGSIECTEDITIAGSVLLIGLLMRSN